MVCPLYRGCPLLRGSNRIILIGRDKFGDLVLSIEERYLIQCPFLGGSSLRGSTVYIYMCTKKYVIERTRDLIYLKFVATDFLQKIISPSAGENSGDFA